MPGWICACLSGQGLEEISKNVQLFVGGELGNVQI
jgi:hypothetical protein